MDADTLAQLDKIQKAGELLQNRHPVHPRISSTSQLDRALRAKDEALGYFRNDDPSREVTEHTLLFVRSLFGGGPGIPKWIGDGRGLTDTNASQIIIESSLSNPDQMVDPSKPVVRIRSGPSGGGSALGATTRVDYNLFTGAKTLTDLLAGTMEIVCTHPNPSVSQEIAEFIRKNFLAFREEFISRRIHDIQNVTVSGFDPRTQLRNQNSQVPTHVPITIVFQYYYQWMMKVSHRKGVYAPAKTFIWNQTDATTSDGDDSSVESSPRPERLVYSLSLDDFSE